MGSGRRTKIALSGETQVRSSKFEGGPPSMTMRTTSKTVTFHRPFWLKGVDRLRACRLSGGDRRRTHRGSVLSGVSSDFDGDLRAGAVRIRGRDGDHRSFGPAGRAGPRFSHAHRAPGRWQVSVTAPRLDRAIIAAFRWLRLLLRKKRAARRQLMRDRSISLSSNATAMRPCGRT